MRCRLRADRATVDAAIATRLCWGSPCAARAPRDYCGRCTGNGLTQTATQTGALRRTTALAPQQLYKHPPSHQHGTIKSTLQLSSHSLSLKRPLSQQASDPNPQPSALCTRDAQRSSALNKPVDCRSEGGIVSVFVVHRSALDVPPRLFAPCGPSRAQISTSVEVTGTKGPIRRTTSLP